MSHSHSHASGSHGPVSAELRDPSHRSFDDLKNSPELHNHSHSHDDGNDHSHKHDHGHDHDHGGHDHEEEKERVCTCKNFTFIFVGVLTVGFTIAELAIGIWLNSLALLSDGFHNLSDALALGIGWYAAKAAKRAANDDYTYGFKRAELLGALVNSSFLLSLSLYIILEAIPRFIRPHQNNVETDVPQWLYVITAAVGLGLNVFASVMFGCAGVDHGHSHGGGGGHSHGGGGGHSHGGGGGHSHGGGGGGGAHHRRTEVVGELHPHSHSHGEIESLLVNEDRRVVVGEETPLLLEPPAQPVSRDYNLQAVFLHFLGDAFSALFVLASALLLKYFPWNKDDPQKHLWVLYVDPGASLIIVAIILFTTIPLLKTVSMILLQKTPNGIELSQIRQEVKQVPGVIGLHDCHVWQLVDGMTIASTHVDVEVGCDFELMLAEVKRVFHSYGIHSCTVQPEFYPPNADVKDHCTTPCAPECDADWCCKSKVLKTNKEMRKHLEEARQDLTQVMVQADDGVDVVDAEPVEDPLLDDDELVIPVEHGHSHTH